MNNANNNQHVYWLLMQVMFQAKHRINDIAEKHGLTMMQSNSLTMLATDGPLPMSRLSQVFMCDASNVTGIADRLEAQGLIKRQDHPTDRRIKLIAITEQGAELSSLILNETIEAEATRLDPILSTIEQVALRELLQKILAAQNAKPLGIK